MLVHYAKCDNDSGNYGVFRIHVDADSTASWALLHASLFSRLWTPSAVRNHTRDWLTNHLQPTSTRKTLYPHPPSSHSCCRSVFLVVFRSLSQLMLPAQGTMSSAIMTKYSWSDQRTRSERSRVTAMLAGKIRGWHRSTIIFQTPILETSGSLVPLLVVCWGFSPVAQQTGTLRHQSFEFEPYIASVLHQQLPL